MIPCDQLDTPAEIGVNPNTMLMYARCNCGKTVLDSGSYDEAVQALDAHRYPTTGTPEEGGQ